MLGKPEVRKAKGKDVFREVFLEGKYVLLSCLATFKTTSMALLFERSCREAGIGARIAPVPRESLSFNNMEKYAPQALGEQNDLPPLPLPLICSSDTTKASVRPSLHSSAASYSVMSMFVAVASICTTTFIFFFVHIYVSFSA